MDRPRAQAGEAEPGETAANERPRLKPHPPRPSLIGGDSPMCSGPCPREVLMQKMNWEKDGETGSCQWWRQQREKQRQKAAESWGWSQWDRKEWASHSGEQGVQDTRATAGLISGPVNSFLWNWPHLLGCTSTAHAPASLALCSWNLPKLSRKGLCTSWSLCLEDSAPRPSPSWLLWAFKPWLWC